MMVAITHANPVDWPMKRTGWEPTRLVVTIRRYRFTGYGGRTPPRERSHAPKAVPAGIAAVWSPSI